MYSFDASQIMIPVAILLIEDDDDRDFLADLYQQYYRLLWKTASMFFPGNEEEIAEAVSDSVERMCRYCKNIQDTPCNKRAAYLVKIIRSVCNTRLGELQKQALRKDMYISAAELENIEDEQQNHEMIFSRLYATDLLQSFDSLSETDRYLIQLRHIDGMSWKEIAALLSMNEGTVRTALSRAKTRLEKLAKRKGFMPDA